MTNIISMTFGGRKKRSTLVAGVKTELPPFSPVNVSLDFDELPETSRAKIIEYGLTQYIGDGAAGAGDQVDFDSGIAAKVAKLKSGDFTRESNNLTGGNLMDSPEKLTTSLIRAFIGDKLKAAKMEVTKEKRAEMIATYMADPAKVAPFRAEAESQIAAHKAKLSASGVNVAEGFDLASASASDALAALGI